MKNRRMKSVTKERISDALAEVMQTLPKKKNNWLRKKLALIPSFLLAGNIEKAEDRVKLTIPLGKSMTFYAKVDDFPVWLDSYTVFLTQLSDLFLPGDARDYVSPKISLARGKITFEYSIVKEEILIERVKELILSFVIGKQGLESLKEIKDAPSLPIYDDIKKYLVQKDLISENFLPKADRFRSIEKEIRRFLGEEIKTTKCAFCGREFEQRRKNQIYCSSNCKVKAFRVREKEKKS